MPSPIHSQAVCVLFERAPESEAVFGAVQDQAAWQRRPAFDDGTGTGWMLAGPSLRAPLDGGPAVIVDVVARPWPDQPEEFDDSRLRERWREAHFGPFSYPGGLVRAAHLSGEAGESGLVGRARAFVRLRTCPALGDGPAPGAAELDILTNLGAMILELPGALAWYAPGGELLLTRDQLGPLLRLHSDGGPRPLPAWVSARPFARLAERPSLVVADTVGAMQLGVRDVELVLTAAQAERADRVGDFLHGVVRYTLEKGPNIIKPEDRVPGPGAIELEADHLAEGISGPPRPVVRLGPPDVLAAIRSTQA